MDPKSDETALVARLRQGDVRAFDEVYKRYRVRIYTFLVRLAQRRDVADDLFQETFVQLARHATRLLPDTNLGAFLYTVARNRYRNHRRMSLFRLGRLRELFPSRPAEAAFTLQPTAPVDPFENVATSDTLQKLDQALSALPCALREALLLVAVEGIDIESAAQILSIKPEALRQRVSRARAQLFKTLYGQGGDRGSRST